MVNNWSFLQKEHYQPGTCRIVYDYYRTGVDGVWDEIQPYYLSNGDYSIERKSPVFQCRVNDKQYTQRNFDQSYVDMIQAFVSGQYHHLWGQNDIVAAHLKIAGRITSENTVTVPK
jgi:hypothetical protein